MLTGEEGRRVKVGLGGQRGRTVVGGLGALPPDF